MISKSSIFELNNRDDKEKYIKKFGSIAKKVKTCEWYEEEYKICKSIKNKIRTYYLDGSSVDCKQDLANFQNCQDFRKLSTEANFQKLIDSETIRIQKNLMEKEKNDVWNHRASPPESFNIDLPEMKKKKKSLFDIYEDLMKQRKKN